MSLKPPGKEPTLTATNSLYIQLQYLRTVDHVNKFHWGLYLTGSAPPAGHIYHATDANRQPMDLYVQLMPAKDPRKSQRLVVNLQIARSLSLNALQSAASTVRLMDKRYLPRGEPQWTCRVWVKEVLRSLASKNYIQLPLSVDKVEERCFYMANTHMTDMGRAPAYNDQRWLLGPTPQGPHLAMGVTHPSAAGHSSHQYYGTKPMDIDSPTTGAKPPTTTGGRYYGPKPMATDPAPAPPRTSLPAAGRYYGTKPMDLDPPPRAELPAGRYYGPKPMVTDPTRAELPTGRYFGPKPMQTSW